MSIDAQVKELAIVKFQQAMVEAGAAGLTAINAIFGERSKKHSRKPRVLIAEVADPKPKAKRASRAPRADAIEAAAALSVGAIVSYKQGRGEFKASIEKVDREAGTVELLRSTDGKRLVRPANLVGAV